MTIYRIVVMSGIFCFGVLSCGASQNIFEAVREGNWSLLNAIRNLPEAEQYAVVNQQDEYGSTPVFQAAGAGNVQIVRMLVGCGASVEARSWGQTPLMNAASTGHTDVVILLLQSGAAVATGDNYGRTALHHAVRGGTLSTVRVLVENHALVNTPDSERNTPLHEAIRSGHADLAKFLIEHGADVKAPNQYGVTPLHCAAESGAAALALYLIDRHADPYAEASSRGYPVSYALESGDVETVELLMARTELTLDQMQSYTFLHRAARSCPETILRKLVELGLSSSQCDKQGCTPLHCAAYGSNLSAARYLINECHADVDSRDVSGYTPVHIAVTTPAPEILIFFLNAGGLIDDTNSSGHTPLMSAALSANEQMINALITYGCPIDDTAFGELKGLFKEWFSEDADELGEDDESDDASERRENPVIKRWNELEQGLSEVMLPNVLKVLIMKYAAVSPRELKRRLEHAQVESESSS